MTEKTTVRENLMTVPNYSPYCGNDKCKFTLWSSSNPRTKFNGSQFVCPSCGWTSQFPEDFINRYKVQQKELNPS